MEERQAVPLNPYGAPSARVEDIERSPENQQFVPGGRRVPALNGAQWIVEGLRIYVRHPAAWTLMVLCTALITLFINLVPIIGIFAGIPIQMLLLGGLILALHRVASGERLQFSWLFAGFSTRPGALVLLSLVSFGIMAGAGLLTAIFLPAGRDYVLRGGSSIGPVLLVLLVGLLFAVLYVALMIYAVPLVVVSREPVGRALGTSFSASFRNTLPLTVYSLIVLGVFLVVIMVLGFAGGSAAVALMGRAFTGGGSFSQLVAAFGVMLLIGVVFYAVVVPPILASYYASFRDIFYSG